MADQETSSLILEFLLRQPIPNHLLHSIFLSLPCSSPFSPRLLKTLLLRRLTASISSRTLDSLELIEQLDRDHSLAPSPSESFQLAYSAVAVDLTARFLKDDRELGDFFDVVNRVWNCRVGDLENSEARGLVSERLREERRLMEEAVVNGVVRRELRRRETGKEAKEAVMAYLKETANEMGPTFLEMEAAAVVEGRDEVRMPVGGNEASIEGGCLTNGFSHLSMPKVIQEKNLLKPGDEKDHHMIEEPLSDIIKTGTGVLTVGTGDDPNLERMEEHQYLIYRRQLPSVDNGANVTHTRDTNSGAGNSRVHDTMLQLSITDQIPTELEHEKENHNALGGNARVFSVDKGKVALNAEGTSTVSANTEGTSTFTGKKRDRHAVKVSSIMDRNPTARTYTWHDDSVESSPEKYPDPSEKLRIPSSKRREIPITKAPWNREFSRRRKKWWSADEEDTLREAVDKYGAGNWTLIKNSYPVEFEDRTPVDLKDKWRNMIR